MNPQGVSRMRQKEGVMLDISLIAQGFTGLSRAASLCHRSVENNTTRQPRSQAGVEEEQREEG